MNAPVCVLPSAYECDVKQLEGTVGGVIGLSFLYHKSTDRRVSMFNLCVMREKEGESVLSVCL